MTIQRLFRFAATLLVLTAGACSDDPTFFAPFDVDPDAVQGDAGETPDGETPDAETPDGETPDAETPDGETPDAETPDAETPDGETPDAETPDGETPDAETPDTDVRDTDLPDTGPTCGNGIRNPGELCDGADLGGSTCQSFAFTGGTLGCAADCLGYDFSGCTGGGVEPVCGNGTREAGEVCDGTDVGGANCQGFGFDRGALTCLATCQGFDFAACENDVCVPDCSGRACGPDPICGESCGTCPAGNNCSEAGECTPASGSPPRFITFDTNVRRITDGQLVRFTAVVTDADGIDDLIGGTLRDVTSGATYGSFSTSAAEGSYQIELSWADIHFVRPIDLVDTEPRLFVAEFFDTAANRVQSEISVELYCAGGNAGAACDGRCVRIDNSTRCGTCDIGCGTANVCAPDGASFACDCSPAFALCGGTCVDRFLEDTCSDSCENCGAAEFCDVAGCAPISEELRVTEGNVLQVLHRGEWRGVCDDSFDALDAEVACRQLGGTLVEFGSTTGPSGLFWLDDLRCTGDESRLADCPNNGWGNENCSADESVGLICSNTGVVCTQPSSAAYISEVFYDQIGSDTGFEFIELVASSNVAFGGTTLELVNSDGSIYDEIVLASDAAITSAVGGFYLLGQSSVAGADQTFTEVIQNGPDAVVWRGCDGEIIDVVQYGVATPLFPEVGFVPAADVPEGESLARFSATAQNAVDFRAGIPTPGSENLPVEIDPGGFSDSFTLTLGANTFTRPREGCVAATASGFRYASRTLTSPGRTLTVTIRAAHSAAFDGYLFAYLDSFVPTSPTLNCVDGNDDDGSTDFSEITVVWPAGSPLIVVATSYDAGATGSSAITVTEVVP